MSLPIFTGATASGTWTYLTIQESRAMESASGSTPGLFNLTSRRAMHTEPMSGIPEAGGSSLVRRHGSGYRSFQAALAEQLGAGFLQSFVARSCIDPIGNSGKRVVPDAGFSVKTRQRIRSRGRHPFFQVGVRLNT